MNLDFELNQANEYVAQVGRYTVRIKQQSYAESPWDAWDCNAPFVRAGDRQGDAPEYSRDFPDALDLYSLINRAQLKKVCRELAQMLASEVDSEYTPVKLYHEARESLGYYQAQDLAITMHEIAIDMLYARNPLPAWEAGFSAMGWDYLNTCSQGYSQGDYVDILFVLPQRLLAQWGIREGTESDALDHARKLWGYWAWGDVYGFVIETPDGEHVDSCFGFYTDSPDTDEESGLLDSIRDSMPDDWQIDPDIGEAAIYTA